MGKIYYGDKEIANLGGSASVIASQIPTSNPGYTVQDAINAGMAHTPIGLGADFNRPPGMRPQDWALATATHSGISEPTTMTLKRARGGFWQGVHSGPDGEFFANDEVAAMFDLYWMFTVRAINQSGVAVPIPMTSNPMGVPGLGWWDYIENETDVTRYSSPETINPTTIGDWESADDEVPPLATGGGTFKTYKAEISSFGAVDFANPVDDNDLPTVWLGPHQYSAETLSWNRFVSYNTSLLAGVQIAVKGDYVYLRSGVVGDIISSEGVDVTTAIRIQLQSFGCQTMKYRKNYMVEQFSLDEPITFTAFPIDMIYGQASTVNPWFLQHNGMPLIVGEMYFGTFIEPPVSGIALGGFLSTPVNGIVNIPAAAFATMFPDLPMLSTQVLPATENILGITPGENWLNVVASGRETWSPPPYLRWRFDGYLGITPTVTTAISGWRTICEIPQEFADFEGNNMLWNQRNFRVSIQGAGFNNGIPMMVPARVTLTRRVDINISLPAGVGPLIVSFNGITIGADRTGQNPTTPLSLTVASDTLAGREVSLSGDLAISGEMTADRLADGEVAERTLARAELCPPVLWRNEATSVVNIVN